MESPIPCPTSAHGRTVREGSLSAPVPVAHTLFCRKRRNPSHLAKLYGRAVTIDRSRIRVKAMLIAPNTVGTAHAVSLNAPTLENPEGFHRLIGGSVEVGETHHDALLREVAEELGATVDHLRYLGVAENIFRMNGQVGHEVVFLYAGRLDPEPAPSGATLIETDGAVVPVVWRPFDDENMGVPLYPTDAATWLAQARDGIL